MNRFKISIVAGIALFAVSCGSQEKKNQIVFWHYWSDRHELMRTFAKEFEEKTGTHVKVNLLSGDALSQKILAAAQAKALPDVLSDWSGSIGGGLAPYVKAKKIMDLTYVYNEPEWKNRYPRQILKRFMFDKDNPWGAPPGRIYGVPLDVNNMQFIYNKKLFEKAGLDPEKKPATWDEFIGICGTLKKAGINPMTAGFGTWGHSSFISMYLCNVLGKEKILKSVSGEIPYTDADWVRVLSLFVRLRDAGVFVPGIVSLSYPEAERMFASDKAAIIYDGSWAIRVFQTINPEKKEYGVFFPPRDPGYSHPVYIPGGAGSSLFISADTNNPDSAIAFVKWITSPENQVRYANQSFNLPAAKSNSEKLDRVISEFADDMDRIIPPEMDWQLLEKGEVKEIFEKGIQLIIINKATPESVLRAMQKKKESL